ncbi:MAG: hypothetical protein J1G38_05195 [Clostridiales bacterium]|nr:hypothetical protein [Clostridiales bacterium]
MSFKNAFKNLISHFSTVWVLLLYIVIFAALIVGVSLPFLLPITRALGNAGVFAYVKDGFSALFNGGNFKGLWDGLYASYNAVIATFQNDGRIAALATVFFVVIVVVAFRFFLGLYEIPMTTVLDGRLSCNANYGFGGKFFSTLWLSVRYSFAKMLFTVIYDSIVSLIIYGVISAMGMSIAVIFIIIPIILVMWSFRFSLVAGWAPCVVNGECGVARGFFRSAKLFFKNFATFYSTYFVSLILIFAIGVFITLFTLGIGLVIVLPIAATYISYLNITEYYNKRGRRYYVDGCVFTPPTDNVVPEIIDTIIDDDD